jgi:hypothetical protein
MQKNKKESQHQNSALLSKRNQAAPNISKKWNGFCLIQN